MIMVQLVEEFEIQFIDGEIIDASCLLRWKYPPRQF